MRSAEKTAAERRYVLAQNVSLGKVAKSAWVPEGRHRLSLTFIRDRFF